MRNFEYVIELIQVYIILLGDVYQSEYIVLCDCWWVFVFGFDGFVGIVIIIEEYVVMWIDGCYFFQVVK